MHKEHPAFKSPSPADIAMWRYMGLPKFISILEDQALHFVRRLTMGIDAIGAPRSKSQNCLVVLIAARE
jgi:hypothetical protein